MERRGSAQDSSPDVVVVRVFGGLRESVRRTPLDFRAADVPTVAVLLARLDREEPDLARVLRAGLTEGYLNTLVNGRNARFLNGHDTPLAPGDVVAFLPPIGGG